MIMARTGRGGRPLAADGEEIKAGDAVRVKLSCEQPVNGWGKVKRNEVGKVILAEGDTLIIDFPSECGTAWLGSRNDIEAVAVDASVSFTRSAPPTPTVPPGSVALTSTAAASGSSINL